MARFARTLSIALIAASCAAASASQLPASAQEGTAQTAEKLDILRVEEGPTITGTVAGALGLYRKYGIEVQGSTSTSSEAMRSRVANGIVDLVDDGLDNGVWMTLHDVDVVIVSGSRLTEQELIAQPGTRSIEDLRGKIIAVDATNTQAALLLKKMLLQHGLKPDADYTMKEVGTRRLPEMKAHKEYAAAMMNGPTAILARRQGFVSLGTSSKLLGPIQYQGSYTRREWARAHADLLSRFLAAQIEAQRWICDPANKEKMMEIIMNSAQPPLPADIAAATYEAVVQGPGEVTPDLRLDVPAFQNFLKLRAEVEGSWGGKAPPAAKLYDSSYYKNALRKVPFLPLHGLGTAGFSMQAD